MKYVYMNERIREPKPNKPVIVVMNVGANVPDSERGTVREANEFEIVAFGQPIGRVKFSPKGLAACTTHEVRAWVEFEDDVELRVVAKASAKKPNESVFVKPLSPRIERRVAKMRKQRK
jgi:hypothetical protein